MLFHRSGKFEMHVEIVPNVMQRDALFIHGNLASNRWWQPAFEIWRQQAQHKSLSGRAILAEWRGCGKSSRGLSLTDFNMRSLADQYIELLEDLGCARVNVIGHSTGGLIALLSMLKAPDRFERAVLLDPVAPKRFELDPKILQAFEGMRQDRHLCELVMASTIHNVSRDNSFFQTIVDDAFAVDPQVWTGVPTALQHVDAMEDLTRLEHPILVVHGEVDPILPKEDSQEVTKKLQRGEYREIAGHGHSLNIEDPKLFVELVNAFGAGV